MARKRLLTAAAIAGALALVTGCSVHNQEAPSLTGPSGLGTTITVAVSPDVLARDGASQSLVTITATGPTGQVIPNLSLRLGVLNASGQLTSALGTLSAQNVVTNSNGQATAIFTAPGPIQGLTSRTIVQIAATPGGTDFGNETQRVAQIALVPQGVIGTPLSSLTPNFTPTTASRGDSTVFVATVVDSTGSNAIAKVASFNWTFCDNPASSTSCSQASGQSVTHTFQSGGNFPVTLTITDLQGSTASVTQSVNVSAAALSAPNITSSPASPSSGQTVFFTSTTTVDSNGHAIVAYAWNFGDGTTGSGQSASHAYAAEGTYTVILTVTDDQGNTGSNTATISVVDTHAAFVFTPAAPTTTTPVSFDGSGSKAAGGRTINTYEWNFGDGKTGTGVTTSHLYTAAGSYTVTLKVTDSAGFTSSVSQTITVTP